MKKKYFIDSKYHLKKNAGLNSFLIDPNYIKTLPHTYYATNSDGSININLTVYFKAQSYLYIGLIVSLSTLILLIGYAPNYWVAQFFKQKKHE